MIEVSHLRKEFTLSKQQRKELNTTDHIAVAVEDVSFTCQPGRVFSLLGPNGAGKTTTLRMCYGFLRPDEGNISIAGHDLMAAGDAANRKPVWNRGRHAPGAPRSGDGAQSQR